jgi:hypothetical protein
MTSAKTLTASDLLKISCFDANAEVHLSCYADTIVRDRQSRIAAIRFGGYPEQVRALADCISSGCTVNVDFAGNLVRMYSDKPNGYYRKNSHDGLYAEAVLYLKDDERQSLSLTGDDGEKVTVNANRNLYIFCEDAGEETLFRELDRKLAVPLIPEFQWYFITELCRRKILNPLKVWSPSRPFAAYHLEVSEDETEIAQVLEDGLKSGEISIPNAKTDFPEIETFSQYLKVFGKDIANRIKSSFTPLFDPENDDLCNSLKTVNNFIENHAGYTLYPAQLAVSEGAKRILDRDNAALIVAECGSGKSKIGAAALHSHQGKKSFNAIICPSHLCKKWVRELEETLPDTLAFIIRSPTEAQNAYEIFKQDSKTVYCIISKEKARDGYSKAIPHYTGSFVIYNIGNAHQPTIRVEHILNKSAVG